MRARAARTQMVIVLGWITASCSSFGTTSEPSAGAVEAGAAEAGAKEAGAAEAGADASTQPGCDRRLDCERVVFVSSGRQTGNLGGVASADAKCTAFAAAANAHPRVKGRKFLAWISSTTPSDTPSSRFVMSTARYINPNNEVIADNWSGLTSGSLSRAISVDETGTVVTQDVAVWTGGSAQGASQASCLLWSSAVSSDEGTAGLADVKDENWSSGQLMRQCSQPARLYCFEE